MYMYMYNICTVSVHFPVHSASGQHWPAPHTGVPVWGQHWPAPHTGAPVWGQHWPRCEKQRFFKEKT